MVQKELEGLKIKTIKKYERCNVWIIKTIMKTKITIDSIEHEIEGIIYSSDPLTCHVKNLTTKVKTKVGNSCNSTDEELFESGIYVLIRDHSKAKSDEK